MMPAILARWLGILTVLAALLFFATGTNMRAAMEAVQQLSMGSSPPVARSLLRLPHNAVVLVTGGAGFVGFHLCMRLHRDGVRVVALDNFDPYYSTALKRARQAMLQKESIEVVEADMCDEGRLDKLLQSQGITHVASMAAQAGVRYSLIRPHNYVRANLDCFLSLLEALRRRPHVRLVYASSSSVYGANTKTPFSEVREM